VLLLVALPSALALIGAFFTYDGVNAPSFAGWQNFVFLQRDPLVRVALINSVIFIAWSVPVRIIAALGLALLYQRPRRAVGVYRAIAYLPTIIPDTVYALVWMWILNPYYGPLNQILIALGLPAPAWLVDPKLALLSLVIMSIFPVGEGFIVLLAGLRQISREVYESASIDGANAWQSFRSITLPLILPWIVILTLRDIALSLHNAFTPAMIMTGGGPYYATTFAPQLIYELAFDQMNFGAAAGVLLILLIITLLLSLFAIYLFAEPGIDED
jgi:multiple sugar transport system permease protein